MTDNNHSPLFNGIRQEEIECMRTCFGVEDRSFEAEEIAYIFSENSELVGVMQSGTAVMQKITENGDRVEIEHLKTGDVFGGMLMFSQMGQDEISVICETPCKISFVKSDQITKRCANACDHHSRLVENMFTLVAKKAKNLSERVDILSRHSIREKLLRYFEINASIDGEMVLPYTLASLADYISTDRSAMMREIKKMKDEGLLTIQGRRVKLLR